MAIRYVGMTASLCAILSGCGLAPLRIPGAPPGSAQVEAFDGTASNVAPGQVRLRSSVCKDFDLRPDYRPLGAADLAAFLRQRGFTVKLVPARSDLVYLDVVPPASNTTVRLRVAILPNPGAAGRDLHAALLQHGQGSWGVHRSNLAVLAPAAEPDDVIAFAAHSRLACWGVLTLAGLDDDYVIPGGYSEL